MIGDNKSNSEPPKKEPYFYDVVEAAFKRLPITFNNYISSYNTFLEEFENKTDGDEIIFIETELEIFEEVIHYFTLWDDNIQEEKDFRFDNFKRKFKPYLHFIQKATLTNSETISNSLERKCEYLNNRLQELNSSPPQNTLNQRLLEILMNVTTPFRRKLTTHSGRN